MSAYINSTFSRTEEFRRATQVKAKIIYIVNSRKWTATY